MKRADIKFNNSYNEQYVANLRNDVVHLDAEGLFERIVFGINLVKSAKLNVF